MAASRIYHILLASTALGITGLGLNTPVLAGPEDGTVTAGSATISQSGLNTSIYQSSDRAVIDWRTFDVNADESVRFYQPGSSSITLNRINDTKASIINGSIEANGNILLLNQNGIVIGSTSRIDVAGLIATTGRIDDAAFMNGSTTLMVTPGDNHSARIINNGTISARAAGLVGLVAPNVENNGVINAHLGRVTLAGAERFTLDLAGDQLIAIDVSEMLNGTAKNTGNIIANGGTITLTASRARDAIENSIINTGKLQANNVGTRNGRIILSAGGNRTGDTGRGQSTTAAIKQAGKIQAASGSVEILGDSIHLTSTSDIDVSGDHGGGTINIGGSYQGGADRPTATWVQVDAGSSSRSNGGIDGNGGSIIFWADRLMSFRGFAEAEGGSESGDGGLVEVSGKNQLIYDGHVSTLAAHGKTGMLLLDPTNIEITALADQNVTGSTPYTPNADDVVSYLNATTLLSALASSSVIVQTRATGLQLGDITVSAALSWSSGNTLTLDAHHDIIINQTIAAGTGGLTLSAGNDVAINAAISGSGTLAILPHTSGGTIGIGTGASGTLQLSNADLGNITDGWSLIRIGRTDGTGAVTMNARTWTDNLEIDTASGVITVNGAQTMGANNLTIRTDADLVLNAALTGTGNLTIEQATAAGTIGLGNAQTGTLNLTTAEVGNITNGWTNLSFGRADGTGAINVGALTWNDNLSLQSASGVISINGAQTMGVNDLTLTTDGDLNLAAALGGTGSLYIRGQSASTGIGLGTGQTGALVLNNAELANITNGWSNIVVGRTTASGDINVGTATWNDFLTLQTGNGAININGAQTMGANNLTFISDGNPLINAALTGSGNLSFQTVSTGTTIGLAGEAGTFNLAEAELLNITDGWSQISIGAATGTGAMAVGAHTWNDALLLQTGSGILTISGAQTMGANTLTLSTNSDIALNAALTGSGTLNLQGSTAGTTMGLAGQAGTFNLDATELGRITDGWTNIVVGRTDGTGAINVGAQTWNDNLTLQSNTGVITVAGAQTMGANTLTIATDTDLVLNSALTGSGILNIQGNTASTTIGLSGQAGTLNLDATELGRITDGWSSIVIGSTTGTGAIGIGATTWNDNLTLQSNTGVITVAGAQTMGANTLTLSTGTDIALNAALTGSGTLNIRGISAGTTIGLAGQAGLLNLDATELGRITDGWANIVVGRTDGTGAINVGAQTWNDNLTLQSNTGIITVAGAQTMGANTLTIATDADLVLNAALTGSGTLNIQGNTATTTIGLSGQAGTLNLTAVEVGRITDGWANIFIGSTTGTGAIGVGAQTWNDNLTLQSSTGIITVAGAQTMGANTLTLSTGADIALNAALTGSGILRIRGIAAGTTIGLAGQAGTVNLDATELGRITDGWANIFIGRSDATGAINIGAASWNDNLTVQSNTGVITIAGTQTMGANALTLSTDSDLALNAALTGTGTLTFQGEAAGTTIGLAGQAGTFNLDATELGRITDGWANIVVGRTDGTGAINVGAATWNDALTIQSNTGVVTIAGAQTMAANTLTLSTGADIALNAALTGSGTLNIRGVTVGTTIGLAGESGALNLDATELGRITDGWTNIVVGTATGTGAINIGAASWNDALTIQSNTGVVTISGAQTMGGNTLTLSTNSDVALNAALTGSGTLNLQGSAAGTTMGLAGQAGTFNLDATELGRITDGWTNIVVGRTDGTGAINVGAATWNDALTLQSNTGVITVAGAQTMGANTLTLSTGADIALNAALTGSGTLNIRGIAAGTTIGLAGQAGLLNLDATELGRITDGWSSIVIGSTTGTGAIGIGATTWNDNLTLQSNTGVITVAGAQTMGANTLTIATDADLVLNAALTGSGTLNIQGNTANTTIGLSGQAGTLNLTAVEVGRITDGWANIFIGSTTGTGAIGVGAQTWNDNLTLQSNTGVITVAGVQTMGANTLTISTDADLVLNAALTGSGTLNIQGNTATTTIGLSGQAGTLNLTAVEVGRITDGWANIFIGSTTGTGAIGVGAQTWNDNLTLQSSTGIITVAGIQTLGANNLTFRTDADLVVNAALNGTGTLNIRGQSANTTMGIGTGQAGTIQLTDAEAANLDNTWTTIVLGRTDGTGDINVGALTWVDPITYQSSTGAININGAQAMGANNLTFITDANPLIGAALGGTATLTFQTATSATTIGLGGGAGTFNLDATELGRITDGWSQIVVGSATGSGAMDVSANTWNDNLLLQSGAGVITIAGTQTMGANALTISTDSDIAINAALTGSGNLTLQSATATTTTGVAGGAGTFNLGTSDLANITDGWGNIIIGRTDNSGVMIVNAASWNDNLTLQSGTGVMTIAGTQTMGANALTLSSAADIALNGDLTGSGTLTIQGSTAATTLGLAGQAGTLNLDATELGRITDGWNSIVIGRTDATGTLAIGAKTWTDNLTLQSGTGVMTVAGTQTMGANNLILSSNSDIVLTGNLTGSGIVTLQGSLVGTTMGLAGQAGTVNLDATELGRITDGWSNIVIGRIDGTGAIALGAKTWTDNLMLQSNTGVITIAGTQTLGANNLLIRTDSNLAVTAGGATGTGSLTIQGNNAATTMGLGGGAGTLNLTSTEIGLLTNTWTNIYIGRTDGTGAINVGALTWADPLTFQTGTGILTISGTQTMGANNLTLSSNSDIYLTGNLSGSGTITVQGSTAATTIGLAGQAGTVNLDAADLTRIVDGWSNIVIGRTDGTGAVNVGLRTWTDNLTLQSDTGVITIAGTQTMTTNSLTINTNADLAVGGTLSSTGTGTLTIAGQNANTTIGLGTGQAGTIQLTDAEVAFLTNNWANVIIGRTDGAGTINVGTATWADPLTLRTLTGAINIVGTQTMTTNNLTIITDGDLNVGGTLSSTGTGTLTIAPQTIGTTIGLGTGQAGTIQLTDAEVANLTNNWASVVIGLTTGTGAINVGTATWNDPLTLRSASGQIFINGTQTMGANNLTITTDANLEVLGALNGTGTLSISGQAAGTSIGLGTGQTGTIQFTDAEVANLSNTFTNIFIGSTAMTGAMNVGALSWLDPLTLRTGSGLMTFNGTQTMAANALTISTDSGLVLNPGANLTGSGNLIITTSAVATTIGLGNSQTGTLNLNTTEIGQITDGWNTITIGNAGGTGVMNVGALTFNDALTLRTTTGAMNLNGALTMAAGNNLALNTTSGVIGVNAALNMAGGGNLTVTTDGNMNLAAGGSLTGTGNLVIQTASAATTIGLGNGAAGTLQLTDVELGRITDGWANHTYGQAAGTGVMTVGANTWTDNVTLQTLSGAINITGAINVGANNLTIRSDGNPTFSNTLAGSGTLTILTQSVGTIVTIAGATTGLAIENSDLGNILNGWAGIIFGRNDATGAMNIGAYTWQYDTTFRTGSGVITVAGAQTSTGNSMTYETDGNMVINANLSGTGTLTIRGSANATSIGLAGGTGTLNIDATELGRIQDGWNQLIFGKTTQTGTFNASARTWTDNVQFISGSGVMTVSPQTMNTATNLTLTTDSNLVLATSALVGTGGKLTIEAASAGTGIGVGTGQTGTLSLDATDISRLGTSWSGIQIGNASSTAAINIGTNSWSQPMTFITQGNVILNGVQTSSRTSGNSLVFASLGGNFVNATGSATPINPGTGTARYLIYSYSAATDTYGTMTPPGSTGNQTYFSYGPGSVVETGNRIIYSQGAPKVIYIQIDNKTKVYGDTVPVLSWTYLGGLQGGDTIGMAITNSSLSATGALVTDNAGTTRTITGSFTMGSGYTVSFVDGTLTVIKAPVTVTAVNTSREYGDANPTFAVTYTGLRNGETAADIDVGAVGATTATMTSNVSTYAITTSGASDNNYVFNYANGTLTITKATLTITADDQTREYGDANPALTVSYSGFKNSETSAVIDTNPTISTTAIATTNVGNVAITLSGGTDNNYNLVLVNGNLSITKAMLTATADDKTREYGDANPALTTTYTGFKNGENSGVIDTAATAITAATVLSNVGSYVISTSGAVDNNYDFTYVNGNLAITKAMLTATADDKTREYGDANPALTITYTGFKNSENSGVIDSLGTASTTAIATTNVGNVAITASGATDNNYDFTYVNGNLAITKATITVTSDDATREYGDANPAFTVSYSGFKNSETASVIDTGATASSTANATTNAGTATITAAGAVDNNYDFAYVNGTLTITKATLTATADNKSRDYGDANPALTTSYTGFKNGETASVIDTAATAVTTANTFTNVGTAVITTSGAIDNNYVFNYVDGVLTINKATLTITADNKTRIYGDSNPALTVSYSGFKNGETTAVLDSLATASTTAIATTNVGNVAITASGAADTNYTFNYVGGTLAITKAMLTATAGDATREYGDANPGFSVSYTGFKNGETSAVIDSLATASTTAIATTNVGNVAITASGATDNNYDFTYVNGNLSITKATLTLTADNKTREYGDANPAFTISYSGFKNSETAGVIDTAPTIGSIANATSNVGSYTITLSGGTDNNYNLILNNGTLSVTKATLTATADNKTREYGDANPALTTTYTGFKNGETSAVIDSLATASTTAIATTNVGNVAITTSGATDNNYDFVYVNGTLAITKAMLTATADNKTREYGDANPALTTTYTGFKNGETSAVIDSLATASTTAIATTNVGNVAITASGAADNNYDFTYVNGNLAITKATLTATADNKTREYGDANPALTTTYTGFKNGETSAVIDSLATASTTAIATTNVGNVAITTSGATDNNYDFTYVNGNLAITKATLTATADNNTREYGDANPTLTVSYTGFKNGETASVIDTAATASTAANLTSNVGSYTISASGALDDNYTFVYSNGSLSVTKAMLTATADDKTRVYGDANPALTTTYTGFKNGETSAVIDSLATASTTAIATTGVGNVAITTSGATDNNYDFTYVNGNLAITKATLTATADNNTREYGDANPALTVSYTGFKNGETASVIDTAATASTAANLTSNVGSYTISASGALDDNYTFVYSNGSLSVTKAMLTATADDKTRVYGDANPALTTTYTGFKNGETSAVIDTAATATTGATVLSNVGSYSITTSGAADNNYDFTYVNGNLAITKAMLTATANDETREYGDANPALTVSYSGFKNGETSGMIDSLATASTTAIATTGVGNVAITASGATDNNYDFTYVNGNLAITKATITVTSDDKTREYGDANPALTVSYTGFKNGETSVVIDTGATAATTAIATTNVGNVAITASGALDDNYNFAYVNGTLAITKAMLTATADDKSKGYGVAVPPLTVSYTGFKNGETSAVIDTAATASTVADINSAVGTYAITASGAVDNNYDFTYVNGTLYVGRQVITVTVDNQSREYGDSNPALTVSYSGFINGDTISVIDTLATANTVANAFSTAGTYVISASGAVDDNYDFIYTNGTLTVTKATLTATADNQTREYGDTNPALGITYSGFKNSETSAVIDTLAVGTTGANALSNVGTYAITASGALDNNYNFVYAAGTLTISKATIAVTADNQTREYGLVNPTLTASYSGFKNGEDESVFDTAVNLTTAAAIGSNVGNYSITAAGAADTNYDFVYTSGNLAITQATLTITADDKARVYGDTNPALTLTYSGLRNGDTVSSLDTQATATTGATILSDAGTYVITASGGSDTNYAYVYVNGTLTVNKADLTIKADDLTRLYGDNNPAFSVTYTGFKNSDTESDLNGLPSLSTSASAVSDVGTYSLVLTGGFDNNYNLILQDGIITVDKATLTVTADSDTRIYGDANPTLTYSYSGFRNSDTAVVINTQASVATSATSTSNVGSYAIVASGASDNNYNFVYVNGSLAITQAALTITANDTTREYGLANPAFTASYSGFKNGESASVLDVGPSFNTIATPGTTLGTYTITVSGASDINYSINFVSGNLMITPASLTISADNKIRLYGEPNPPLTYTITGLRNGDTDSVLTGLSISTVADNLSALGNYAINVGGASATNYTINYSNGTLSVVNPPPPPEPVTSLPGTAESTLHDPGKTGIWYNALYNTPEGYVFINNVGQAGHEIEGGTIRTQDGYITIFYYQNPFEEKLGEPLLFIDPNLYIYVERDEEDEGTEKVALN